MAIEEYVVSEAIQENAVDVCITLNAGDITRENVANLLKPMQRAFRCHFPLNFMGYPFPPMALKATRDRRFKIPVISGRFPILRNPPKIRKAIGAILSLSPEF